MNELIDVVHQTAESGLSPKEAKDILSFLASDWSFLIGMYFVIFVFVFFFIRNCMLCAPFYTMLCTCLVKTLYGVNYNNNNNNFQNNSSY